MYPICIYTETTYKGKKSTCQMMTNYFVWVKKINFSKTLSVLANLYFFFNFKASLNKIFIEKNYLNRKSLISF